MSIKIGLEMGVVRPLATSVLLSTYIYLEKAAKLIRTPNLEKLANEDMVKMP